MKAKKKNSKKNVNQRKIWLVAGISLAVLIVAVIIFYTANKETLAGEATAAEAVCKKSEFSIVSQKFDTFTKTGGFEFTAINQGCCQTPKWTEPLATTLTTNCYSKSEKKCYDAGTLFKDKNYLCGYGTINLLPVKPDIQGGGKWYKCTASNRGYVFLDPVSPENAVVCSKPDGCGTQYDITTYYNPAKNAVSQNFNSQHICDSQKWVKCTAQNENTQIEGYTCKNEAWTKTSPECSPEMDYSLSEDTLCINGEKTKCAGELQGKTFGKKYLCYKDRWHQCLSPLCLK